MAHTESSLPRLRSELRFSPIKESNQVQYILEDPVRNTYYRIGLEEYLFISRLNQASGLEQLLESVAQTGDTRLDAEQAQSIISWLAARQLLQVDDAAPLVQALEREEQQKSARRFSRLNIITIKIPLFNPDPLLDYLSPKFTWLTGRWFAALWLILAVSALGTLFSRWQEFSSQTVGFFSAGNVFFIWLIWFFLKLFHELFHALVCRRYGGRVYEAGILLILFIPLTYVNATSSWNFPSKWQRIHVAVAGMFIELGIGWAALLIWAGQPNTTVGFIAHNTFIIASVSSLLFNANPLMRFDGYYVLSDLIGIPNLYSYGLQFIRSASARWFLGIVSAAPPQSSPKLLFVRFYGVAIYLWRLFILVSLGYIASTMAGGFGILATIGAVVVWAGMPVYQFFKRLPFYRQQNPHVLRHLVLHLALTLLVVTFTLRLISWEQRIQAPAIVEYRHQYSVRPETDGFVSNVHVTAGQQVSQGTPLLTMENTELSFAARDLQLQIKQLELERRLAQSTGQLTKLQILREQEQNLSAKLQDIETDLRAFKVLAKGDGVIVGTGLDSLEGTYLFRGQEIFWIVSPGQKQITASASQDDVEQFRALINHPLKIDMRPAGLGIFTGTLKKVSPTATSELIHPALGAVYGGPLDVRQQAVSTTGKDMEQRYRFELFAPRFKLDVELPAEMTEKVNDGQPATLYTRGSRISLGRLIANRVADWLQSKKFLLDR
jgi:putative peptide zinc metalloprotease protein